MVPSLLLGHLLRGGGLQNGREAYEVLPLQKGGGGAVKVLAILNILLKGRHNKSWGSLYAVA